MKTLKSIEDVKTWRREISSTVGFVPTMGALHDGHMKLVEAALEAGDTVIASIFVNPTQFNDPKDLERYPRTVEADLALLEKAGATAVFLPNAEDLYQDSYRYQVIENRDSKVLCGEHRPGHFNGVLTVVLKLFHLVRPDRAYFGEKDLQQLRLIQGMVDALFLPVEIVPVATAREADGLAMSSRNRLLSTTERERAPAFPKILKSSKSTTEARRQLQEAGFKVDYVEERWGRRLGAVHLGHVRLIDNVEI